MQPALNSARSQFKQAFTRISAREPGAIYSEAAFPSYAHWNPLIDRLFWGRLSAVDRYLTNRGGTVLDFGCGSGVMSYVLATSGKHVYAYDPEPAPFATMRAAVTFPAGIEAIDAAALDQQQAMFDVIIALDVLEHVSDLRGTLARFRHWLKPGGEVVISGPTENALYKAGRRLAGKRFTGDYHVTDIRSIRRTCDTVGTVRPITTLYPWLPLFDIFALDFTT